MILRGLDRETEAEEYERKAEQVKENLEKANKGANELNPLGAEAPLPLVKVEKGAGAN